MRLAALLAALAACGPKVEIENPSVFEEDDPRAGAPLEKRTAREPIALGAVEPAPIAGEVLRGDFERVLAEGPGRYVRAVDFEPVMDEDGSALIGWEVITWPYRWLDLRRGDIVLAVNETAIIRPDDVDILWKALEQASALDVRVRRGNTEVTIHVDIVDVAMPPP